MNATSTEWEKIRDTLRHSKFRSRFTLQESDKQYIQEKGLSVIRQHAIDFIQKRLAPGCPPNDGKQTPMRGHPVFIAQHATATCCRGCLQKWHGIERGRQLTEAEVEYIVDVIMCWIIENMDIEFCSSQTKNKGSSPQLSLFDK